MIRALETTDIPVGPWRRLLIEYDDQGGGISLFLFADPAAELPDRDYAVDTLEQAKEICRFEWGVPHGIWRSTVPKLTG